MRHGGTGLSVGLLFMVAATGTARALDVRVVQDPGDRWHVEAAAVVNLPRERLLETVRDYNHLADFIPNIAASRWIQWKGRPAIEEVGQMKFLWFRVRAKAIFQEETDLAEHVATQSVAGDFRRFEQLWQFSPAQQGTRVLYKAEVVPSMRLPEWVVKWRVRSSVETSFQAMLARAAQNFTTSK